MPLKIQPRSNRLHWTWPVSEYILVLTTTTAEPNLRIALDEACESSRKTPGRNTGSGFCDRVQRYSFSKIDKVSRGNNIENVKRPTNFSTSRGEGAPRRWLQAITARRSFQILFVAQSHSAKMAVKHQSKTFNRGAGILDLVDFETANPKNHNDGVKLALTCRRLGATNEEVVNVLRAHMPAGRHEPAMSPVFNPVTNQQAGFKGTTLKQALVKEQGPTPPHRQRATLRRHEVIFGAA